MFFTKEFVMSEISEARKLVEEVHDESVIESPSLTGFFMETPNGTKLQRVLFKLDVIHNAVANVHTN